MKMLPDSVSRFRDHGEWGLSAFQNLGPPAFRRLTVNHFCNKVSIMLEAQQLQRQAFVDEKLRLMEERCRKHRLSLTVQRRTILENLSSRTDHPTADQIYAAIQERISGVSRTTVYRVLETFVKLGLAQKICNPEAKARFDADTSKHHHAACVACEEVFDIDSGLIPDIDLSGADLGGFEVFDCSVVAVGLCKTCSKKSGVARSFKFN